MGYEFHQMQVKVFRDAVQHSKDWYNDLRMIKRIQNGHEGVDKRKRVVRIWCETSNKWLDSAQ